MTLSFSSFSIKDILSGRDAREMADDMRTEGLCTEDSSTRVRDVSHRGADKRLSADLSLSNGNLRSDSNSEEITGDDYRSLRRDGKKQNLASFCS